MSVKEFIGTYFAGWRLASESHFGREKGYLRLRDKETVIEVRFDLNGDKHWSAPNTKVTGVRACERTF